LRIAKSNETKCSHYSRTLNRSWFRLYKAETSLMSWKSFGDLHNLEPKSIDPLPIQMPIFVTATLWSTTTNIITSQFIHHKTMINKWYMEFLRNTELRGLLSYMRLHNSGRWGSHLESGSTANDLNVNNSFMGMDDSIPKTSIGSSAKGTGRIQAVHRSTAIS